MYFEFFQIEEFKNAPTFCFSSRDSICKMASKAGSEAISMICPYPLKRMICVFRPCKRFEWEYSALFSKKCIRTSENVNTWDEEATAAMLRKQRQQCCSNLKFTDDCGLAKMFNLAPIHVIGGEEGNIKITYPIDLFIADRLFQVNICHPRELI
jgi:hypothetical protein